MIFFKHDIIQLNICTDICTDIALQSKRMRRKLSAFQAQRNISRRLIRFLIIFSTFASTSVLAESTIIQMTEGESSFDLPHTVNDNDARGEAILSVELAGYDISSFSQLDHNGVHVELNIPIAPGEHNFQALLFWPNGDIDQLFSGKVIVSPSSASETKWKVNTLFSPQYRLDDKNVDLGDQDPFTSTGSIEAQAQKSLGQWQIESNVLALYDSVNENDPHFNEWALAQFNLASRYKNDAMQGSLSLGDGINQKESLLFSAFQRRGVAASLGASNNAYQLQVFDVRANPTTRYDGDYLADDTADQAIGIQTNAVVIDNYLNVSVGFVDGKTDLNSADPQNIVFGGESWNLALDSYFLEETLWLHAEYAQSNFDNDGENLGASAQKDQALQTMVQLSSGSLNWFSSLDYWSSHLQYQEVGKDFYSLGNMSLPGDLRLTQAYFQAGIQSISFDIELSQEENNLDNNPALASQTLKRLASNLSYQPSVKPSESIWQFLGAPSFHFGLSYQDHSQSRSDSLKVGFDLDNQTLDSTLGINFSHQTWTWGLSYQRIVQEDNTEEIIKGLEILYVPASDLETTIWGAQASWFPNNRVSLNAYIQWNLQSETDFNYDYINQNIGLDGIFEIMPNILSLSMNINLTDDQSDLSNSGFIEDDRSSQYTGAQLTWHAMAQDTKNIFLDVYLRGNYGTQDDHALDQSNEQWAIYLGTEFQWSAGGI